MRVLKDFAQTGYPNKTREAVVQAIEKGKKTVVTKDGTKIEAVRDDKNGVVKVFISAQNLSQNFVYKPNNS